MEELARSAGELLAQLTALEINTTIVDRISARGFVPWDAYREIYRLDEATLEAQIHPTLRDRYRELRQNLLQEWIALTEDPTSDWDRPQEREVTLPNPQGREARELIYSLLHHPRFRSSLRKQSELKILFDRRNQALQQGETPPQLVNTIYAQTIIQLDGSIFNHCDRALLDHPQQQLLWQLHRDGVAAGEVHWRGLIRLLVGLLPKVTQSDNGQRP